MCARLASVSSTIVVSLSLATACGSNPASSDARDAAVTSDGAPNDGVIVDAPIAVDADPLCTMPGTIPPMHLVDVVTTGLVQPVFVTAPKGDLNSLYVVEKQGRIKIIRNNAVVGTFLDISANVAIPDPSAEGGLLGLAFAPDYATSGRFFVYYSAKATNTLPTHVVVQEYRRSANPDVASPTMVAEFISAPHQAYGEVGGSLVFGKDGMLYASVGDGHGMPSPASNINSKLGKILRINTATPGVAPTGNLPGGDPFVWDYGLRNSYRISVDRANGNLYLPDLGDATYDEVNVELSGVGKHDFGWPRMEGAQCAGGGNACPNQGTLPVVTHLHPEIRAIIGGYVYRGSALPCLRGRYIYADYISGRVFSFVFDGANATSNAELTTQFNDGLLSIVGFGEDAAGEIYTVQISGTIKKLVPGT
ncbi:MAG TPA: PQQ-dependent sugar dehydrogenase [Kofleriaceae bacterium]|nr:PQQ-dependent sugar dehydrogenase [Kofleriaceae bacterium]